MPFNKAQENPLVTKKADVREIRSWIANFLFRTRVRTDAPNRITAASQKRKDPGESPFSRIVAQKRAGRFLPAVSVSITQTAVTTGKWRHYEKGKRANRYLLNRIQDGFLLVYFLKVLLPLSSECVFSFSGRKLNRLVNYCAIAETRVRQKSGTQTPCRRKFTWPRELNHLFDGENVRLLS